MVFAQGAPSEHWVAALVGTLAGVIGASVASFIAYLRDRDKMRYDAKILTLSDRVQVLESDVAECKQDKQSHRDHYQTEIARLEREKQDQRQEIHDLRNRLYKQNL